jgi:ribosomal protein S18 acetylase RimI-like enzyme
MKITNGLGFSPDVAVHVGHRGQGLSKLAVAKLCQELIKSGVEHIGLNVKESNEPAIRCYKSLGFTTITSFMEIEMVRKPI